MTLQCFLDEIVGPIDQDCWHFPLLFVGATENGSVSKVGSRGLYTAPALWLNKVGLSLTPTFPPSCRWLSPLSDTLDD
jgi:hypothetical protein